MRKLALLAGLLLAATLIPGTAAKADMLGCSCVRLGAPAVCSATVLECNFGLGGVCVAPCDYSAPKKMTKHRKHKKKKKM